MTPIRRFSGVVLAAVLTAIGPAAADALKDDAIARLASSHEPDVPLAVGRLAVKQAGLGAVRTLLARRGGDAGLGAETRAGEDGSAAGRGQCPSRGGECVFAVHIGARAALAAA